MAKLKLRDNSSETGENWIFSQDVLDTRSILNTSLRNGVSDRGTEDFVKLLQETGPEAERIGALPRTWRTTKKRVVQGSDLTSLVKRVYTFPEGFPLQNKRAPLVLKKLSAVLEELLEDPDLVQPGNFYFGDYSEPRAGEVTQPHQSLPSSRYFTQAQYTCPTQALQGDSTGLHEGLLCARETFTL